MTRDNCVLARFLSLREIDNTISTSKRTNSQGYTHRQVSSLKFGTFDRTNLTGGYWKPKHTFINDRSYAFWSVASVLRAIRIKIYIYEHIHIYIYIWYGKMISVLVEEYGKILRPWEESSIMLSTYNVSTSAVTLFTYVCMYVCMHVMYVCMYM